MSEILQDAYSKLSDQQRLGAIADIVTSSARLDCFDTNVKILSGLSKGKLELNRQMVDLSALIVERVARCQKLYDPKPENHEIILKLEPDVQALVDKDHILKAIDNLIINAIQFCPKDKIEIELKRNEEGILFVIRDEGIGIPKGELSMIFDDFKVSSKTHSFAGGRGTGLTVSKKIIELHGGKIWAESDGIKGSVLQFILSK